MDTCKGAPYLLVGVEGVGDDAEELGRFRLEGERFGLAGDGLGLLDERLLAFLGCLGHSSASAGRLWRGRLGRTNELRLFGLPRTSSAHPDRRGAVGSLRACGVVH
jgi:hypothetical protein